MFVYQYNSIFYSNEFAKLSPRLRDLQCIFRQIDLLTCLLLRKIKSLPKVRLNTTGHWRGQQRTGEAKKLSGNFAKFACKNIADFFHS